MASTRGMNFWDQYGCTRLVIFECALNVMKFCNKCCNENEEELESEHGSDSDRKTESVPMTETKTKTRQKKRTAIKQNAPTAAAPQQSVSIENKPICNLTCNVQLPAIPQLASPSTSPGQASSGTTTEQSIVEWVASSINEAAALLDRAVVGGYDIDDTNLWIIRARFKCEVIPGKYNHDHRLAFAAHKKEDSYLERNVNVFEVCCIAKEHRERIRWTKCTNGDVPKNAVEGGRKSSGEILYIGRQNQYDEKDPRSHSLCPGMIQPSHGVLYVTFGYKVYAHKCYEVLCIE